MPIFAWLLKPFLAIARFILPYIVPEIISRLTNGIKKYFADKKAKKEEAKQNAQASEEYKQKVADPNATREDRKNAEDDYLNS